MKRTTLLLAMASVPVLTGVVATGIFSMMAPPLVAPADGPAPILASAAAPLPVPAAAAPIATDTPIAASQGDRPAALPGEPMLDPQPMLDPTPPGERTPEDAPPQQGPETGVAETTVIR